MKDADTTYNVYVMSSDGDGFEEISCPNCIFTVSGIATSVAARSLHSSYHPEFHTLTLDAVLQYRSAVTAYLMDISPLTSTPGAPLTLSGTFRATDFDDSDDPKDPQSTDTDDEGDDYFTRILIGGRGCNHMKEDGTL